ncbi:UNVERIFIED_CONTAM: hypothetical protein FKN15_020291 [Acipenser sinensis]
MSVGTYKGVMVGGVEYMRFLNEPRTTAFLSESLTASVARSLNKIEDTKMLNDFFSPSKAHLDAEGLDKSEIIVFTDLAVKKNAEDLQDFLISANSKLFSPALSVGLSTRHLPYFTVREAEAPQPESQSTAREERRDSGRDDSKIPVGRRDFDMLRCMLGRVYRPCWQDLAVKKNAEDLQDFLISANSKLFSPALSVGLSTRHLPYFTVREAEAPQPESQSTAREERRDSGRDDSKIPVGRRDFDTVKKNAEDLQDFLISANSKLFSPALSVGLSTRHLPYFTVREAEAPQPESQSTAREERRDSGRDDSKIPVGRRDFDSKYDGL